MLLTSYTVPNTDPRCLCARNDSARPAAGGRAVFRVFVRRDQQCRHETARDQHDAHDERRTEEQLVRVADASVRVFARDLRHDGHAGLEPGQPEREVGEDQGRYDEDFRPVGVGRGDVAPPAAQHFGVFQHDADAGADN
jgi:hypothetical protein